MNDKLQNRIDAYILGRMNLEEKAEFEKSLLHEPELRAQYRFTQMVREEICAKARLQSMMERLDREIEAEENNAVACASPAASQPDPSDRTSAKRRRILLRWTAVAAILVLGIVMVVPTLKKDNSEIVCNTVPTADAYESSIRSGGDLRKIDALLEQQKYEQALSEIALAEQELQNARTELQENKDHESAMAHDVAQAKDRSRQGASGIQQEKNETPDIAELQELQDQIAYETEEIRLREIEINWRKAKALLGLGKTKEAKALLDDLRKAESPYRKEAQDLYQKLS